MHRVRLYPCLFVLVWALCAFGCDRLKKTNPLVSALRAGAVEKVKMLLKKGAHVNTVLWDGSTPMIAAAQSGKIELIKLLLSKGAKVNVYDASKKSPLMYANYHCSGTKHYLCLRAILDKGGDINDLKKSPFDALFSVCAGGKDAFYKEAFTYYIKKGLVAPKEVNKLGSPLHCAAKWGMTDYAMFLLKHGAKAVINATNANKETALHVASAFGKPSPAMLKLLLDSGVKVDAVDQKGKTAYYYLDPIKAGPQMLTLLKRGIPPETPNKWLKDPKKRCKSPKDKAAFMTCLKGLLTTKR